MHAAATLQVGHVPTITHVCRPAVAQRLSPRAQPSGHAASTVVIASGVLSAEPASTDDGLSPGAPSFTASGLPDTSADASGIATSPAAASLDTAASPDDSPSTATDVSIAAGSASFLVSLVVPDVVSILESLAVPPRESTAPSPPIP